MKCENLLLYEIRGKVRPKRKLVQAISQAWLDAGNKPKADISQYETCCGNIKVSIGIDPGYGDYDACDCSLDVTCQCDKCGCGAFAGIPYNDMSFIERMAEERIAQL